MNTLKETSICPFCKKETTIGSITTPKTTICLCQDCHTCWEVFEGKADKLIRLKNKPDTNNEQALCPYCWREMRPDFKRWFMVCPDPICGYEKKIPGISQEQIRIKKEYIETRTELFKLAHVGEEIPPDLQEKLRVLREQYIAFSKNDPERL